MMDYILVKLALFAVTILFSLCIPILHKLWVYVHIKEKAYESDQYFYNRACSIALDVNYAFAIYIFLMIFFHEKFIFAWLNVDYNPNSIILLLGLALIRFVDFCCEFAFNYINKDYFWVRKKFNISETFNSKKAYMLHYSLLDLVSWKRFNKKWKF